MYFALYHEALVQLGRGEALGAEVSVIFDGQSPSRYRWMSSAASPLVTVFFPLLNKKKILNPSSDRVFPKKMGSAGSPLGMVFFPLTLLNKIKS